MTNRQIAESALSQIVDAIEDEVRRTGKSGMGNADVARELGLQTDVGGGQRNHLTHALLNRLVAEGRLLREQRGTRVFYVHSSIGLS